MKIPHDLLLIEYLQENKNNLKWNYGETQQKEYKYTPVRIFSEINTKIYNLIYLVFWNFAIFV